MKLTIFWRIIIVQSTLVVVIVLVSLYAFIHLEKITQVSTNILTEDSVCVSEEKRLLKIFLAEMRNAEKYLILQDQDFYVNFVQGKTDFASTLEKIAYFIDTPNERELVEQIKILHNRYDQEVHSATSDLDTWKQTRSAIGDEIIISTNELIRLREQIIQTKTTTARDQALSASRMIAWFALEGIGLALLLAYIHARSISRPLNKLAREMRRLGRGEPIRSLVIRTPPEVCELANTFYWMTEELAQLDRLKADFTAHVSHELRTPLTAIREGTALLLEGIPGPLAPSQTEILEVVRNHSGRLYSTISSILDLSKMEAEMMEYEFTACDLSSLIDGSLENVRLIAEKRRVNLCTDFSNRLPIVFVDERRIQQVLDNLLSNALKFTPEGGEICVAAGLKNSGDGKGNHVEIRVSDDGEGIPETDLEKVFTKFFQSPKTRPQRYRGTGLGLAIAHHVVQAHRGSIWVESHVGRGSTFVFTIPIDLSSTVGDPLVSKDS